MHFVHCDILDVKHLNIIETGAIMYQRATHWFIHLICIDELIFYSCRNKVILKDQHRMPLIVH